MNLWAKFKQLLPRYQARPIPLPEVTETILRALLVTVEEPIASVTARVDELWERFEDKRWETVQVDESPAVKVGESPAGLPQLIKQALNLAEAKSLPIRRDLVREFLRDLVDTVGRPGKPPETGWDIWGQYDDYPIGARLPITGPPCAGCEQWYPHRYRQGNSVLVTCCASDEQYGDFSCFKPREVKDGN